MDYDKAWENERKQDETEEAMWEDYEKNQAWKEHLSTLSPANRCIEVVKASFYKSFFDFETHLANGPDLAGVVDRLNEHWFNPEGLQIVLGGETILGSMVFKIETI